MSQDCIKVFLKSNKGEYDVDVDPASSVKDFRQVVAQKFDVSPGLIVLVSQGTIMKDHELLAKYKISHNSSVHLVVKGPQQSKVANVSPTKTTTAPVTNEQQHNYPAVVPSPAQPEPAVNPTNVNNNSNLFGSIDKNAFMSKLSSKILSSMSPDQLASIIESNPLTKNLLDKEPSLRAQLTPSNLKKMAEIMSNPVMAQELLRNQDNLFQSIQNIPGGAAELKKIMSSMGVNNEDGGFDAFNSPSALNETADNNSNNNTNSQPNLNAEPLPNPWSGNNNNNTSSIITDTMKKLSFFDDVRGGNAASNVGGGNANNNKNVGIEDDANSLFNLLGANKFGGMSDPMLDNYIDRIGELFSNPATMQEIQNPEVFETIKAIKENLDKLQRLAPSLVKRSFLNSGELGSIPPVNPFTESNDSGKNVAINPNLVDKYKSQLEQMKSMGFSDEKMCIRALEISNGDVQLALEWLFNNQFI